MPRNGLSILLAILAASVFLTPLRRELYVGDETKYAQVVREIRGGAVLLPTLEGSPFTHKPPIHFWAITLLTFVFGLYSVWPFVLPSILGFLFLLWLMWRMGGPLAAFVCGTSLMIWGSAQSARMDVSFTALTVLAAWLLQRFLDTADRRALLWAALVLGVAILVKGLMAPVIGGVLLIFEWIRRRRLPRGNYLAAAALIIVIPLLWFVPAMTTGGEAYTREVLVKQTAGRAVGAWVHKAEPWFYLVHAPADLFPWFFLLVVAIVAVYKRRDEPSRFYVSWFMAVLVPYSLLSSKLDVYMMAMIPPASLIIGRFVSAPSDHWSRWGWRANLFVLALLTGIGAAGFVLLPRYVAPTPVLRGLFVFMALAALVAMFFARNLMKSTMAVGVVPILALVYVAVFLVPMANELASTRPLVRALLRQQVPPQQVSLYSAPHLWTRDMPRQLEQVGHASPDEIRSSQPALIVTSRKKAGDLSLNGYRRVDEFQMIGKWFDVYRR